MIRVRTSVLFGLLLVVIVGVEAVRWMDAIEKVDAREAGVLSLEEDAKSIEELRQKTPVFAWRERPQNDWITLINKALSDASLSADRLESLVPDESGGAGTLHGVRRQSVRCVLKGLSLSDLGRFLDAMRRLDPEAPATSIDVVAVRDSGPSNGTLRATLTFSTLVLAES